MKDKAISSKRKLFDDEENLESSDFNLTVNKLNKSKSEKLVKLKSKYAYDERFKIDERFVENESEEEKSENEYQEEKDKNLELLEQVIGHSIKKKDSSKLKKDLIVPRFDPLNPQSSSFETNKKLKIEKKSKSKNKSETKNEKPVEVIQQTEELKSGEHFYEVSSTLKDSFGTGQSVSLKQLFGRKEDPVEEITSEMKVEKHKKLNKNFKEMPNPFQYDSSDTEDEDQVATNTPVVDNSMAGSERKFFFHENDSRFDEDIFFRSDLVKKVREEWKERQQKLHKALGLRKQTAKKNAKADHKWQKKYQKMWNNQGKT